MGSWATQSEAALATLVCGRLGDRARRLMIGGLGMGFTLTAALAAVPENGRIEVVELVPGVVEWAKGPLAHLLCGSLADLRVVLTTGDVHDAIARERDAYDAILLDVDNGPDCLVTLANERLYSEWGLRAARAALRTGGILALWSAYPDPAFPLRLCRSGFDVEEVAINAGDTHDPQVHTIWLAHRRE